MLQMIYRNLRATALVAGLAAPLSLLAHPGMEHKPGVAQEFMHSWLHTGSAGLLVLALLVALGVVIHRNKVTKQEPLP